MVNTLHSLPVTLIQIADLRSGNVSLNDCKAVRTGTLTRKNVSTIRLVDYEGQEHVDRQYVLKQMNGVVVPRRKGPSLSLGGKSGLGRAACPPFKAVPDCSFAISKDGADRPILW